MWTGLRQPIGNSQLYGLLVDASGNPVLDADNNKQVVAIQSTNGRLQVDAQINGSLTNQITFQSVRRTCLKAKILRLSKQVNHLLEGNLGEYEEIGFGELAIVLFIGPGRIFIPVRRRHIKAK